MCNATSRIRHQLLIIEQRRPTCSRCQALRTECVYEAQEGESRWSALRRRKRDVEADRDDLRELLGFLQQRPEAEALDIFHRIRTSGFDDLLRLIRYARDAGQAVPSNQLSMNPAPADQQRLPPIQSIFNLSGPSQQQTQPGPSNPGRGRMLSMSSDGSGESLSSAHSGSVPPTQHPTFPPGQPSDQPPGQSRPGNR
jgi:hypothetical protein